MDDDARIGPTPERIRKAGALYDPGTQSKRASQKNDPSACPALPMDPRSNDCGRRVSLAIGNTWRRNACGRTCTAPGWNHASRRVCLAGWTVSNASLRVPNIALHASSASNGCAGRCHACTGGSSITCCGITCRQSKLADGRGHRNAPQARAAGIEAILGAFSVLADVCEKRGLTA